MLGELCAEIRNYFVEKIHIGKFVIKDGALVTPLVFKNGQHLRIVGSTLNDGVYSFPVSNLIDEEFEGAIWALAIPPDVIALADDIKKYKASDVGKPTAYTSESFGGYSYSKATDSNGVPLSWQKVFATELNKYRRARVL